MQKLSDNFNPKVKPKIKQKQTYYCNVCDHHFNCNTRLNKLLILITQNEVIGKSKMKYHDKLNLKSPIFKYNNNTTSRTPTKSPIKPSMNPSDLFQKVCCPNCKYGFKIIRQQVMKENPSQCATPTAKKFRLKEHKQTQTQTQGILTASTHNFPNSSPTKSLKIQQKLSKTYDFNMTSRNDIDAYQYSKVKEVLEPQNSENRHIRDSDFKFKPLSLSPDDKRTTMSRNLLKTLDTKKYKIHPSDSLIGLNNHLNQPNSNGDNNNRTPIESSYVNSYVEQNYSQSYKNDGNYRNYQETDQATFKNQEQTRKRSQTRGIESYYKEREINPRGNGLTSPHGSSDKLEDDTSAMHVKFAIPGDRVHQNDSFDQQSPNKFTKRLPSTSQISKRKPIQASNNPNLPLARSNTCLNLQIPQSQPYYPSHPQNNQQLSNLILQMVYREQQNKHIITCLKQFCQEVGGEVEVSAVCKMLAVGMGGGE